MAEKYQLATTIKQSQRLLEAGVSLSSADMYWRLLDSVYFEDPHICQDDYVLDIVYADDLPSFTPILRIPAWSLSRLIDLIAETGLPMNYGPMTDSTAVLEHAVYALEYHLRHADH